MVLATAWNEPWTATSSRKCREVARARSKLSGGARALTAPFVCSSLPFHSFGPSARRRHKTSPALRAHRRDNCVRRACLCLFARTLPPRQAQIGTVADWFRGNGGPHWETSLDEVRGEGMSCDASSFDRINDLIFMYKGGTIVLGYIFVLESLLLSFPPIGIRSSACFGF